MGIFDSMLGDGNEAAPGLGGIQPTGESISGVSAPEGKALLSDPNFLQLLASIGGNLSQGQGAGQAFGDAAMQFSQNQALQSVTAKQSQSQNQLQRDMMQKLIDALSDKKPGGIQDIVGPKDDPNTLDGVNFTGNGLNMKFAKPQEPRQSLTDEHLEGITGASSKALPFS
jgi:hypothetical protein